MADVTLTPEQLAARLPGAVAAMADLGRYGPLGKVLEGIALAGVREHFATSTGPGGERWPPPRLRAGKPLLDQGTLRAAVRVRADAKGLTFTASHPGAQLHQHGGVVRPRGKFLAVPLTAEARRSGGPRSMGGLHFRSRSKGRSGALVDSKGVAHWALVTAVAVPARPFLGVSAKTGTLLGRAMSDFAGKLFSRALTR